VPLNNSKEVRKMSVKYSNVKGILHQERMHKIFIDRLIELGVTRSQLGTPVRDLDYDESKYEYTMAAFREIDAENDNNRWY
jgi:hypothetical protein